MDGSFGFDLFEKTLLNRTHHQEPTLLCTLGSRHGSRFRLGIKLVSEHAVDIDFALGRLDWKLLFEAAAPATDLGSSLFSHDVNPNG